MIARNRDQKTRIMAARKPCRAVGDEMRADVSTDSDGARQQVRGALATSDARLRALLEAAVDGIITIDERGLIQTINPAAERLFGLSTATSARFTELVGVAIQTNRNGGTLSGVTTVRAVGGVARFSGLNTNRAGSRYVLRLTSKGLPSATTNPCTVLASPGFGRH